MAKYYDIDTSVRINGSLTINGDSNIPSNSLNVGGTITGNIITGNTINAITFNEGGTTLSSKYLGINATAVNSTQFNSLSSNQFVRSDTQTNVNANIYFTSGNGVQFQSDASDSAKIYTEYDGTISSGSARTNLVIYVSDDADDAIVHRIKYYNSGNATDVLTLNYNKATFDAGVVPYVGSNKIFHQGFMGSGSGLDADTIDTLNSSQFLRSDISTTLNGNLTVTGNITSTLNISGNHTGTGSSLIVNGTTTNGGQNPISNGWAYTHENKVGSLGHIPSGGTNATFLRGDNTWITPTDTDTYVTGLSSTSGGNGTLTLTRNTGGNLTIDLSHHHDSEYYTQSQIDTKLTAKDWYGKWTMHVTGSAYDVTSSGNITITGNGATSVSMSNGTITISSTDNNTWRPIDTTPTSGDTTNSIASSWAYTHINSYGLGSHVPTGGSNTTFLRGDGTWVTPTDTYVTGLSSTAGGNGTLTVTRNTGGNLTLDLSHNHNSLYLGISGTSVNSDKLDNIDSSQFLRSDQNSTMSGILTISGTGATPLVLQRNGTLNVNLQFTHNSGNGFLGIDSTGQLKFGSVADLNASGYTVWHSNNFSPTSKVDSTTFATHTANTGVGYHIPTGGTTSQFLRGDGTWQTVSTIDTYMTGLSATNGGNGTLTVSQNQGQSNLTVDLTHNHDSSYLGISGTAVNATLFNSLSSNQFVRNDSSTTMGVGLLFNATATSGPLSSTPTALSYGQLQAYGTLNILADTDGSHTEFLYLSAGYPSGGASNGLKIGYNLADLTWKGYTIWHSGNMGSGSNLDADKLDGHDSTYFAYVGQNNLFKNMSGGVTYNSGVDMNTLQTVGEYRFINIASSGSANMPSGSSGMGYYFGMGGGDVGSRGFQLLGTSAKELYFREISSGVWGRLWSDQNMGASSGLNSDMVDGIQGSSLVRNDVSNQAVGTGFTMSGNAYIGGSSSNGALYIRTGSGSFGIQIAGDNSAKQSGVGAYINASGTATFTGTMTANTIAVTSTSLVTNLNSQMVNSVKEPQLAKNTSINELGGMGIYSGIQVQAQAVPNMTVQLTAGTVYTNTGMRISVSSGGSYAFASPSVTYNRIDSIYVQGSSAGANEGVITVATGTASASPVAPTIPSDGVLLANVTIRQNAGTILQTDISDMRVWKPLYNSGGDTYQRNNLYIQGQLNTTNNSITVSKPLQLSNSSTNIKITSGNTSATWTHNLNLTKYAVTFSCDNAEPHVYWSNKTTNAITFNLDDVVGSDVNIDVILIATQ